MPTDAQRIQKRTPATVALQVSSAKQPFITELAFTENVSLHGVRVVTERAWKPGERVTVKSYHGTIQSRATVIYCHHLAKKRYAVGLELHSAVGTWADTSQPPEWKRSPRAILRNSIDQIPVATLATNFFQLWIGPDRIEASSDALVQ